MSGHIFVAHPCKRAIGLALVATARVRVLALAIALVVLGAVGSCKPFGAQCASDSECASLTCWDAADFDPYCSGKSCSRHCSSDQECIDAAGRALAGFPQDAFCGEDGLCNMLLPSAGNFICE